MKKFILIDFSFHISFLFFQEATTPQTLALVNAFVSQLGVLASKMSPPMINSGILGF